MPLSQILHPDGVFPALKASSKKQVLQYLAEKAALQTGLAERDIFETLIGREKLGSTGVGNGVAIPHGKLDGLSTIVGMFARLAAPVDFESPDDQPVDLVFLLLAPNDAGAEHLKTLAKVARLLRETDTTARLRNAAGTASLVDLLTGDTTSDAA